jgi:predicted permease
MISRKPHLWLITLFGVIVPRRLRADWRMEWEAELRNREEMGAAWDRLDWRNKLDLLRHSLGAFRDALWMQPRRWEDEMIQDLRYGIRMLIKNPGFTLAAVLCLALGIGANTSLFSLVNTLLFRPMTESQPEQLVSVSRGRGLAPPLSYPDFVALRDGNDVLSGFAASETARFNFANGDRNELLLGQIVSGNYFEVLGVQAEMGRMFSPEEDRTPGAYPVVVISRRLWEGRLGRDPAVIGKTISLNGHRLTVIGVAPSEVGRSVIPGSSALWVPTMMFEQLLPGEPSGFTDRRIERWGNFGRLKPGVSVAQAQTALETINRRLELADPLPRDGRPGAHEDRSLNLLRPVGIFLPHLRRIVKLTMTLLAAVMGVVLLIACANVANLLLARASARRQEIAIRLALGAGRFRLVRQLLTESLLLASLGAAAGWVLAYLINRSVLLLETSEQSGFAGPLELRLDAQALVFTVALSLATSLVFSIVPALQATTHNLTSALKNETGTEERRGRRWGLRSFLVSAQVAISLSLLITAGLLVRSLVQLQTVNPGFRVENGLTFKLELEPQGYDETRGRTLVQRLAERIASLPGVQTASMVNYLALGNHDRTTNMAPAGRTDQVEEAGLQLVGLDFFKTMGVPLLGGRNFTELDSASAPKVAILNETAAARLFPGQPALGKQLGDGSPDSTVYEVVGIARDTAFRQLGEPPRPVIYRPFAQQYSSTMNLVVHTHGDPRSHMGSIREATRALDAKLVILDLRTLEDHVASSLWAARIGAGIVSIFGILGLALTVVGLYGVMSYAVARRTREIGVRMALGAREADVMKLILRHGLTLTLTGAGVGVLLSLAATRLLSRALYGVSPMDPMTYAGVVALLIAAALAACYLPARKATKVDPIKALRTE